MKKVIYLSALLVSISAATFAQRGSNLLYGNFGVGNQSTNSTETKYVNGNLGFGYQFDNNWTVGLSLGLGSERYQDTSMTNWNFGNTYRIAPFVRYTHRINKLFAFYTQAEVGYLGTSFGNTSSSVRYNSNGIYGNITPALSLFFYKGWALNFSVGGLDFNHMTDETSNQSYTDFDVNIGRQAHVGVSVNFFMRPAQPRRFEKHRNREVIEDDGYSDWRKDRKSRDRKYEDEESED